MILVTANLVEAKHFQEHYANRKVREAELHEGDRVALRTEGLRLQGQPSSMLKQRYLGPFEVIEKLSPLVYKLKLPKSMKIHPVVHISKLRLWRDDLKFPDRIVSEALAEQHMDIAQGEVLIDSIMDVQIAHNIKLNRMEIWYYIFMCDGVDLMNRLILGSLTKILKMLWHWKYSLQVLSGKKCGNRVHTEINANTIEPQCPMIRERPTPKRRKTTS